MSGQSDMGPNLLPDRYGFIIIRFQINHFLFSEKYTNFIYTIKDRVLPTIRHIDKILGKVSPSPYSPKLPVAYLFHCPDPPLIDWT